MLGTGMPINFWAPYCLCRTVKIHSRKILEGGDGGQGIKMIAGVVIPDWACEFCVTDLLSVNSTITSRDI